MSIGVSRSAFAVGVLVTLAWPSRSTAQTAPTLAPPPTAAPVTAERRSPPNGTLLGAGVSAFVLGYGAAVGVAISSGAGTQKAHKGDNNLYIPAVGPWLD